VRRWQWVFCALFTTGAFFYQGVPWSSDRGVSPVGVATAEAQKRPDKRVAKKRAIRRCVSYKQEQYDDGLSILLKNRCDFDLSCSLSWRVRCDEDESGTKRSKAELLTIDQGNSDSAYASASVCGDDGWRVTDVRWSCEDAAE